MRKMVVTIVGALAIAGSTVQMATASEHHARKAQVAPIAASQQLRNANNSVEGRTSTIRRDDSDFERRNTFN